MNIRIRYFASLRETTGLNEETLPLPGGTTVAALRATLLSRYPRLHTVMERAVCAVNHHYVSTETILHEGDEVVFISPVGGGRYLDGRGDPRARPDLPIVDGTD